MTRNMTKRHRRSLENVCFALILFFSLLITLHAATAIQQYDDDLRPDLKVRSMDFFPSNPKLGQNVTIFYTIENAGDLNIYDPVEVGLFINNEDTGMRSIATNDFDIEKIRPGEKISGEFHYVFDKPEHKGSNRVEIRADIDNTILESLERNNEYEKLIFIRDATESFNKGILQIKQSPETRPAGDDFLRLNQPINQIVELIRDDNLDMLKTRYFKSESDRQRYKQTIKIGDDDFRDSDIRAGKKLHSSVIYDFDDNDELGDYLFFDNGKDIFMYELEFLSPFISNINNSRLNIEGEIIQLMGENYIITKAELDGNELELEFTKGESLASLREGETRTFDINGEKVEIELLVIRLNDDINQSTVTFRVNDKLLKNMKEGEIELVDELDFIVAVNELVIIDEKGRPDYVELFLGTKRIEFEDNFQDNDFSSRTVEVNGENIRGSNARIKAQLINNNTQLKINSFAYKLEAYTDYYIPTETSLKEFLVKKSRDNKDAFLSDNFNIFFQGLSAREKSTISFAKPEDGSLGYELEFENNDGQFYSIPLVYFDRKNLHYGDELFRLHFIEPIDNRHYNIAQEDFFILTDSEAEHGNTHIISYEQIRTRDKKVVFVDLGGKMIEADYTGAPGSGATGELVFDDTKYKFYIGFGPDYKLAVDMNGDSSFSKTRINIVTKGGVLIEIGSTEEPGDEINLVMTLPAHKLEGISDDEEIRFKIFIENNKNINLQLYSQNDIRLKSTRDHVREGRTRSGALFTLTERNFDAEELTISYPMIELEPLVYVIGQPKISLSGLDLTRIDMKKKYNAGETVNVGLTLNNIGLKEQKNVKVSIIIPDLGITTETATGTDLRSGEVKEFNMNLRLPPCVDEEELDLVINIDSNDKSIERYEKFAVEGERCSGIAPMFDMFSQNRALITPGDSEEYEIKLIDLDSETLKVEWYINDKLALEETVEPGKKSSIKFTPDEEGEYTIKVTVSDEEQEIEKQWSIIVSGEAPLDNTDDTEEDKLESDGFFYTIFKLLSRLVF